jgi:hypothetical protein
MPIKAKKPDKKEKRLKAFLYGGAGIGKTTACCQFPKAVIIDTERGTDEYSKLINDAGSVVLQSVDVDEICADLTALLTEKHEYLTVIIDPVTILYESLQDKWNTIFERNAKSEKEKEMGDWGMRYWGKVKADYKRIQRILLSLDMNVICTAHQKDVYGNNFSKIGVTFSSMKGDDYFFDYIFRLIKRGSQRLALVEKERATPGDQRFPEEFEWSYENFLKFYGQELERESQPLNLATPLQIKQIQQLIENLNISDVTVDKWLTKADVDNFEQMQTETIQSLIDAQTKKLKEVQS